MRPPEGGLCCTLAQIKAFVPDALTIAPTAQVTKGRDYGWHGAVDGLQINDDLFDFEAGGTRFVLVP